MPLVSVIVPNYNHSKYLVQRLDSIMSQTFQDFEIILLDDNSTDNSKEILERYAKDQRVTHAIYNDYNSGSTFLQWEKGINLASGNYIWIAETDDWCEPTLLETLIAPLINDKECVISYCQSYCINDLNDIKFQSTHRRLEETVDGRQFIRDYLSVPVAIFNASMVLWRKEQFQFIPKDFTSFKFAGDWFFWIQLAKNGNVHISAKALNYFRKHDGDVSGKAYKSGLNFIEELKIINQTYKEGLITENAYYKAIRKTYITYWLVRNTIDKTNKTIIKTLFSNSLSHKTSLYKLTPIAIWKQIRGK
jgi:glycosyltransferase involved in cell wall biosynthesis